MTFLAQPLPHRTDEPRAASSVHACRELARRRGSSFYHGMRLIPEPTRTDTYVLYAWLRQVDDLADGPGEPHEKVKALRRFWERTCRAAEGDTTDAADSEIWHALAGLFARHALPLTDFRDMLNGQLSDLRNTRYETFDELYDYCVRVASTVGTLCIELWGYDGRPETRQLAVWRGVAFQLTNVLRDVREDALADRVYVPAECAGGPLTPADVLAGGGSVRRAVRQLLERASDYYTRSAPLDACVAPSARRCLWTMTETYHALLCKIAADPSAVFQPGRVRLGAVERLGILFRSALR